MLQKKSKIGTPQFSGFSKCLESFNGREERLYLTPKKRLNTHQNSIEKQVSLWRKSNALCNNDVKNCKILGYEQSVGQTLS